jgi:hypothetical protein
MNWDYITAKATLTNELKRSGEKDEKENILHFILDVIIRVLLI